MTGRRTETINIVTDLTGDGVPNVTQPVEAIRVAPGIYLHEQLPANGLRSKPRSRYHKWALTHGPSGVAMLDRATKGRAKAAAKRFGALVDWSTLASRDEVYEWLHGASERIHEIRAICEEGRA